MVNDINDSHKIQTRMMTITQRRRIAWILILIADIGLLAWGAMAALIPQQLLGPGSRPILPAGYEGYTNYSWSELVSMFPKASDYITLLFRLFGVSNITFAIMAIAITVTAFRRGERWAWWTLLIGNTIAYGAPMTYDRIVNAIGPFEMLEYVGVAVIYIALAITAPFNTKKN
ncbi:MAG: hypothetical protein EPN92_14765 [Chitinophagaceae bacterium]|nr:MAG: hypothetical protein EPN92_14765 [Chitinophagaceae bacterium]